MKKTTSITEIDDRQWFLFDAAGIRLGKLASNVARKLIGKDKADISSHLDNGDNVVVINMKNVDIHPKKVKGKLYWRHTGYPGAIKSKTFEEMLDASPEKVMINAVKGMLPQNKLKKSMIKRLHVYADEKHLHEAQKPKIVDIK